MNDQPVTLLTEQQIAEIEGVSVRTVRRRRAEGGGPPYIVVSGTIRKIVRYPADSYKQFVAEQIKTPDA
jgi:hypothetical protein